MCAMIDGVAPRVRTPAEKTPLERLHEKIATRDRGWFFAKIADRVTALDDRRREPPQRHAAPARRGAHAFERLLGRDLQPLGEHALRLLDHDARLERDLQLSS